jgi:hypothetical protein
MTWTEARVDKLLELIDQGDMTAREIGAVLGLSRNAVIGKSHRLGRKIGGQTERLPINAIRRIVLMAENNFSYPEIGRAMGINRQTAASYHRRHRSGEFKAVEVKPAVPMPTVPKSLAQCMYEDCRLTRHTGSFYCPKHHTEVNVRPNSRAGEWNGLMGGG